MKKLFKIIKYIVNTILMLFVLLFLLMVCLQRFTNNEISFFNYRMFTVASGSMAPEYEVGDVLIARETPPEKIKVGDSITYLGQQGSFKGKVVTHSVTRIEKDKTGKYIFHTKGIANLVEDPPVFEEQVYGVIVWNPLIMSFIYKIINTKYGLFIFVILPIFYIFGSELLSTMLEKEEERRAKIKEKKAKDEDKENDKEIENKEDKEDKEIEKEEQQVETEQEEKEKQQVETEQEEKEKQQEKTNDEEKEKQQEKTNDEEKEEQQVEKEQKVKENKPVQESKSSNELNDSNNQKKTTSPKKKKKNKK